MASGSPAGTHGESNKDPQLVGGGHTETTAGTHAAAAGFGMGTPFFGDLDPAFLTMSNTLPNTPDMLMTGLFDGEEANFGGLNLFPLLETGDGGGHIDLAHTFDWRSPRDSSM